MSTAAPPHLRGLTPETLFELFAPSGLSLAGARRIASRLLRQDGADLDGIPGLSPAVARDVLAKTRATRLRVVDRRRSSVDPFVKYLFQAQDGRVFEAVRIPLERPRFSVCVSSQVGCALACGFCETGRLGFARNLEAWEMVEQVLTIRRESRERPVTGVVFQGQGEPFLNYENVLAAAQVLRHPCGPGIGADRITISTVGVLPMIERYTAERHAYRLILSLTSAFTEKRAELVPLEERYPVPRLAAAMLRHAAAHRGTVHLAWVLISGWNTGPEEARELARLFPGARLRVSVIDVNDPSGRLKRADDAERGRFLAALAENGIGFVRRYSGGPDIDAACGLLAARARGGSEL
jgi:23S rRNA (adenine2503-C2)-methyltransferase